MHGLGRGMTIGIDEYDSGGLRVVAAGVEVSREYPEVSTRWTRGGAFLVKDRDTGRELGASGLLVPTSTYLEDNGVILRLWRLTVQGKKSLASAA